MLFSFAMFIKVIVLVACVDLCCVGSTCWSHVSICVVLVLFFMFFKVVASVLCWSGCICHACFVMVVSCL